MQFQSYAVLSGRPTICGGYDGTSTYLNDCFSYGESGQWDLVATLPEPTGNMAWAQLSPEELVISGEFELSGAE